MHAESFTTGRNMLPYIQLCNNIQKFCRQIWSEQNVNADGKYFKILLSRLPQSVELVCDK